MNTLKKEENNSACIFFVNRSLQMTIAGRYELENTLGSQNEALPSQISHLINNILENLCFTHVYLILLDYLLCYSYVCLYYHACLHYVNKKWSDKDTDCTCCVYSILKWFT